MNLLNFTQYSKCLEIMKKFLFVLYKKEIVLVFLAFFLLPEALHADTNFNPDDRSHLNISLASGNDAYNTINFNVLVYDYNGTDDMMRSVNIYVIDPDTKIKTLILSQGAKHDSPNNFWTPINNITYGYFYALNNYPSKDLRFRSYSWQFPQRFSGKALNFIVDYEWDRDHNGMGGSGDKSGSYSSFTITPPAFEPITTAASFIPQPGGNVKFNFTKTSTSSPVNKLYVYADAANTRLLNTFNIDINATSGTSTFLWDNSFSMPSQLYLVYAYVVNDVSGNNTTPKEYKKSFSISEKAYIRPINFDKNYDKCKKNITLSWNVNNLNAIYNDKGQWVIDRKLKSDPITSFREVVSGIQTSARSYIDETIEYDREYDFRLRFIPEGMDKSRIVSDFNVFVSENTKRTVLNTFKFETFTKTTAQNPRIIFNWIPNWCFNPRIYLEQYNSVTKLTTSVPITSVDNNATTYTHENLTENLDYKYRLKVTTEGTDIYTEWQPIIIKDEVKFKSVTSSKGTLADRIQIKWNVERNDLSNSFFLKRQIYEEGKDNPKEEIANITTDGKYFTYEDRNISPGVLYKYTLGSQFKLQSERIDTVYYKSDIIGYAQASGTVSGRVTFGSGTSVDSVTVFATNANESESLYRAMKFNGTGGLGQVALSTSKHGCVKDGFTWQAWFQPQDASSDMAVYECFKEYSIWYENSTIKVYLDQIDPFAPMMAFDLSYLKADEYVHASVSFDGDASLKLFINGELVRTTTLTGTQKSLVNVCENTILSQENTIAYLGDGFLVKGSFKGNIDDMRLWERALTAKEIKENYNRYINGNETGLIGYWQFDEGLNRYSFDRSNYKKIYNEHHITFTQAESTKAVPTLEQLSIKGITDINGNYLISGVPFTGEGSTYSFTPSKASHDFEPMQLMRHLTYQTAVQNEVDFKDVSSFPVRINVSYDETTFPSDSVEIHVDGSGIFKDKKIVATDAKGECIIEVPIGVHTITAFRRGHTFVDGSKASSAITMNFKEPVISNPIKFYDTTKSIVAGRVVGGVVQGSKPLGFGLSKANIGQAEISITVPDGDYMLNEGSTVKTVAGAISDTIKSVATIAAKTKTITIKTDPKTGEFRVALPPLRYKVANIKFGNTTLDNKYLTEFVLNPNTTFSDTLKTSTQQKIFSYNKKLNITYRVDKIAIEVIDPLMPALVYGDSIYNYTDPTNNKVSKIRMYTYQNNNPTTPLLKNGTPDYKYSTPIYTTSKIYKLRVFAYEQYTHPENSEEMAEFCKVPASNAIVSIANEIGRYELPLGSDGDPTKESNETKTNTYKLNDEGIFDYTFKAGFPNLVAPYTLGLNVSVDYEGQSSSWEGNTTFKAKVLGDILTGTDFVTSGPDLISFVLRDPAGSNSYSYMEKGTTISNSYNFTKSYVGSENFMGTFNYGQKIGVAYGGLFVLKLDEIEIDNKTGAGFEIEQSAGSGSEFNISTTTTERIETSSSPDYVGRRGDIYVGTATNMYFGSSKRLRPILAGSDYVLGIKDEKVGNLVAETNFKYTYAHITETLLPNLKKLRHDLLEKVTNMSTAAANQTSCRYVTDRDLNSIDFNTKGVYRFIEPAIKTKNNYEDEVAKYSNYIKTWEAELAKQEDEKISVMEAKDESVYTKTNISADAGVTTERSVTVCGSSTKTEISTFNAQAVIKTENGFAYNNFGFQFEFETKHGSESETVKGSGEEYCTTYGYVLADENPGDYLSVDVFTPVVKTKEVVNSLNKKTDIRKEFDSYSGAPIFVTRGGRTSCPYEPQDLTEFSTKNPGKPLGVATLQVEKPQLRIKSDAFVSDIPSGKEATFKIELSNLSESNTAGWYMLTVDEQTNTKGAIITVDGQTLGNGKLYNIVPGQPMEKILKLKQSSMDELDYNNIKLLLSSTCDGISSDVNLTARFIPSCSDVTLEIKDKIVNTTTSDELPIVIKNYNRDYKNFGGIYLQYKTINQDENGWTIIRKFVNNSSLMPLDDFSELITGSTINYKYSMAGKDDQTYQFRAITICKNGTGTVNNESEVITVVKDMVRPTSLGTPSPSNGILTPESEVSITFNEDIQNNLLNATNLKVEGILNGYALKNNVGLEFIGSNDAYTEQQFSLQAVPVSVEAWFKTNQLNTAATLFAFGEGANQLKLELDGNTLKAYAGTEMFSGAISADENWQYVSLGYNPTNKKISVYLTGQANNNAVVIDKTISGSIEPSGRLLVGKGFKGNMAHLSVWMKDRTQADIAADKSKSKSGRETGIIGYWPLNEGAGKMAADKVNSRHLTLNTGWFIEPKGRAISLNGTNQNVLIATATNPITKDQDFSLEFWFKANSQANATMFSCAKGVNDLDSVNSLSVGFGADRKLTVYAKGAAHVITNTNLQDGQWHHFAMSVLRSGNTNVLLDGVNKYQVNSSKFGGLSAAKMSVGARYYKANLTTLDYTTDNYFNGLLDEVRIWRGALTVENIRLDMNNKLKGSESGLIAYYPFEEYSTDAASQTVIAESLKDAIIPENGIVSGGTATGSVVYTDQTPAIKEARVKENVYFNSTSTNNKIVLNILEPLKRIENCVLEFTVDRVLDLNGNRMSEPIKWTVFVDNNRLKWESDGLALKKEVLAPLTFKSTIVNKSGKYENYVIDGLPSWLSVNKSSGTINPLDKVELTFTVDNSINVGSYESRVTLTGNNGIQELFPVSLKVTGPRPDWTVNPYDFESSMNITGQITIDGNLQEDSEDLLAAFVGNKCVGIVNPKFNKIKNSYLVYMDVYGNVEEANKTLTFSLWDAGTGRIYPGVSVVNPITFTSGSIIGSVVTPVTFNATDKVEQQLNIKKGWNWISTNVVNTSPSLLDQLKSGLQIDGISLKSKTQFSNYSATSLSWAGSLTSLNQKSMYLLCSGQSKTVKMTGSTAKSLDLPISIGFGWNWIGYVPQFVAPIQEALSSINPIEGDQIKGQVGFATYSGGVWNGSLQYLVPGQGYMYNSVSSTSRTLSYPMQYISRSNVKRKIGQGQVMHWSYDENDFPQNMTLTAIIKVDNVEVANEDLQVAAFIDNKCHGTINLMFHPDLNRYFAYLTVLGDGVSDRNKVITFKCYNPSNNRELTSSDNSVVYTTDVLIGSVDDPKVISFSNSTDEKSDFEFSNKSIYPNPVINTLNFGYNPQKIEWLEIIDCTGRTLLLTTTLNKNSVEVGGLLPGVYTVRINYSGTIKTHRFVKK